MNNLVILNNKKLLNCIKNLNLNLNLIISDVPIGDKCVYHFDDFKLDVIDNEFIINKKYIFNYKNNKTDIIYFRKLQQLKRNSIKIISKNSSHNEFNYILDKNIFKPLIYSNKNNKGLIATGNKNPKIKGLNFKYIPTKISDYKLNSFFNNCDIFLNFKKICPYIPKAISSGIKIISNEEVNFSSFKIYKQKINYSTINKNINNNSINYTKFSKRFDIEFYSNYILSYLENFFHEDR